MIKGDVVQYELNSHTRFNLWKQTTSFQFRTHFSRCAPHTWSLDAVSTRSPFQYGALAHHVLATARISRPLPRSCLEILSRLCILARRVAGWNCNQCLQLAVNFGEPHAMDVEPSIERCRQTVFPNVGGLEWFATHCTVQWHEQWRITVNCNPVKLFKGALSNSLKVQ